MKFHILARALNHDCFPKFSRFECVFDPSFPGICPCSCLTLTACTNSVLLARCEDHVPALVHDAPARPFSHTMQQGAFGAAFRVSYDKTSDIARCNSPSLAPSAAASCPRMTCVIKRVDIERRSFKLIMRESWFLQQLRHPHIAHLLHQYMSPNSAPNDTNPTYYFVQEDCGQNLMEFLRNRILQPSPIDQKLVPLSTIENVLQGLLSALVCLERYRILHRDIKEDNCLIFGEDHVATLIDFGLAKTGHASAGDTVSSAACDEDLATHSDPDEKQSNIFQRPYQYAPETLGVAGKFTHKSDLWAVGTMVIWPLLFWACRNNLGTSTKQSNRKFPFPPGYPASFEQTHLKALIDTHLLKRFEAIHPNDKRRFETICQVLEKMCAHFFCDSTQQLPC